MSWKLVLQQTVCLTIVINANSIFVFISRRSSSTHFIPFSWVGVEVSEKHIIHTNCEKWKKVTTQSICRMTRKFIFCRFLSCALRRRLAWLVPHTRRGSTLDREFVNKFWMKVKVFIFASQSNEWLSCRQKQATCWRLKTKKRELFLYIFVLQNGNRHWNSTKQINYNTHLKCVELLTAFPLGRRSLDWRLKIYFLSAKKQKS